MSCNDFDVTIDNVVRVGQKEEETINVTPTKENQVIYPTPKKTIGKVNVEPIPSEYIIPSGEITITEQGTFDVSEYEQAVVTAPFDRKFAQLINGTLTEITEEDLQGATKVNDYAFYNQANLISVELSDTIETIGASAFYNNKSLRAIEIPNVTETIGASAFQNCVTLLSFSADNVDTIGENTFNGCSQLKELYLPKLKSIPNKALEGTSALTNYNLDSVETIVSIIGCGLKNGILVLPSLKSVNDYWARFDGFNTLVLDSIERISFTSASIKYLAINTTFIPTLVANPQSLTALFVRPDMISLFNVATNWSAFKSKTYPLVQVESELSTIDTTLYNKAFVRENTTCYNYTNGEWVKE